MKPNTASSVLGDWMSPSVTMVAGDAAITPAPFRPMMARNRPTPAEIASFSECGIALTISSRIFRLVMATKITPEMNTAPSAVSHGTPMPLTTAKVK